MNPRYPVYVPSRGRADYSRRQTSTIGNLSRDDVPFYAVVEPQDAEAYAAVVGEDRVLVLPQRDFGILRVRNWICDHAEASGAARHWQLDDNIKEFRRLYLGRRIPVHCGVALRVCEDMSDRYTNVGISGLNYQMFVPDDTPKPFALNVHVYSCTLINHAMPFRYRLACNEDVDICLLALARGWCTIALNAFMANKERTMVVKGGNTDRYLDREIPADAAPYRPDGAQAAGVTLGEGSDTKERFDQTRLLERAWPGLVKTSRRFGRFQHVVNWRAFADSPRLELADGVDLDALPLVDEYGLRLREVRPVRSPTLRALLATYEEAAV